MTVIEFVKDRLMTANQEYTDKSPDHYNFWEQHIKLVVKEALILAEEYGANKEIIEHDYNDLSDRTKQTFKPRYDTIMDVLFGALV